MEEVLNSTVPPAQSKREHERQDCDTAISYRLKKVVGQFSGPPQGTGKLINVSEGGMMFECPHKLGRGSLIVLDSKHQKDPTFKSDTLRIVWSEKRPSTIFVAAEFV